MSPRTRERFTPPPRVWRPIFWRVRAFPSHHVPPSRLPILVLSEGTVITSACLRNTRYERLTRYFFFIVSGSSSAVTQLTGTVSALAASVWEAHGLSEPSRANLLKHLRLDASSCLRRSNADTGASSISVANASAHAHDTASVLAALTRHALQEHGPVTALSVLQLTAVRFPANLPGNAFDTTVSPAAARVTRNSESFTNFSRGRALRLSQIKSLHVCQHKTLTTFFHNESNREGRLRLRENRGANNSELNPVVECVVTGVAA